MLKSRKRLVRRRNNGVVVFYLGPVGGVFAFNLD